MESSFFIRDNFDIIFQSSQIENPEDAKVFVIGQIHLDAIADPVERKIVEKAYKIQNTLIENCSVQNSALFIESWRIMQDVKSTIRLEVLSMYARSEDTKDFLNKVITPKYIENHPDRTTPEEYLQDFPLIMEVVNSKVNNILYKDVNGISLNQATQDQITKVYGWDLPSDFTFDQESVESFKDIGRILGVDVDGKFGSLIILLKKLSPSTPKTIRDKCLDMVERTFPLRTENMAECIYLADQDPSIEKSFFKAGLRHVQHLSIDQGKPDFSLEPLYTALEKCRGVALVPKILGSDYENEKVQQLFQLRANATVLDEGFEKSQQFHNS